LRVTKTDQDALRPPLMIAGTIAVRAMWRWVHMRRAAGALDSDRLFALGARPLSQTALLASITSNLHRCGYPDARLSGKCFRRGGASALFESGASASSITTAGRWATENMFRHYISATVDTARREHVARAIGALSAGTVPTTH
jgi:hypothetical protein